MLTLLQVTPTFNCTHPGFVMSFFHLTRAARLGIMLLFFPLKVGF